MSTVSSLVLPIARANQKTLQKELQNFPLPGELASRLVLDYWLYRNLTPFEAEQEIITQVYDLLYNDQHLFSEVVDSPNGDEAAAMRILTGVQRLTGAVSESLEGLLRLYPVSRFTYLKLIPTPVGIILLLCPSR